MRIDHNQRPQAVSHRRRVMVVEDEGIVRKDIEAILGSLGHDVVASCGTCDEAVALCHENRPEVVLMDIQLRDGSSGIDAANRIHESTGTPVIFITANTDQATVARARVTMPFGYIAKPFRAVDLMSAIEVAAHNHAQELKLRMERDQLRNVVANNDANDTVFAKVNGRMVAIRTTAIHFVEALKDYVGIHVADKRYVVLSTMNEIAGKLPVGRFMRVHRSFIVQLDRIKAVEQDDLIMEKNDLRIPIGGMYRAAFRDRFAVV